MRGLKKSEGGGDFKAIKPLQIAPENAGSRISEALKVKIFRGSMPPDLLGATAFGGCLSEPLFVKSWIRPSNITMLCSPLRYSI